MSTAFIYLRNKDKKKTWIRSSPNFVCWGFSFHENETYKCRSGSYLEVKGVSDTIMYWPTEILKLSLQKTKCKSCVSFYFKMLGISC